MSAISKLVGGLQRNFIKFPLLGSEISAPCLHDEPGAESHQIVVHIVHISTFLVSNTTSSPPKTMPVLESAPAAAESATSGVEKKDRKLTLARRVCVITSSKEDVEDLNAFCGENLLFVRKKLVAACWI